MEVKACTKSKDGDKLTDALTSLQIRIRRRRELMKRMAVRLELEEVRAKAIEQTIRSRADAALEDRNIRKIYPKPEPLYAKMLKIVRKYSIASGRPLKRQDVIYWMEIEGHELAVKNPEIFITKNIYKSKAFVVFEEGYWPADLPIPSGVTPNRRHGYKVTGRT